MADGIRTAKRPQPGGFDLSTFAPSLDAEAGESLGAFLEEFKSTEQSDLRARLAHAEEALNAIENLCAQARGLTIAVERRYRRYRPARTTG